MIVGPPSPSAGPPEGAWGDGAGLVPPQRVVRQSFRRCTRGLLGEFGANTDPLRPDVRSLGFSLPLCGSWHILWRFPPAPCKERLPPALGLALTLGSTLNERVGEGEKFVLALPAGAGLWERTRSHRPAPAGSANVAFSHVAKTRGRYDRRR